jgi:murein DD-endopeptidase MepM/ murein hydrolase activator NlpD
VVAGLVAGSVLVASSSASAATYPTWQDVQNAKASESAKSAEIATINALIADLQAKVDAAQKDAEAKGELAQAAQLKYDEASQKAVTLEDQATAAKAKAKKSQQAAGQLAARLAQSGGGADVSATMFFNGSRASALLSELGLASLVKDQSSGLYEKAIQDRNSAQSMTDQATVARNALGALSDAAAKASADATAASEVAANALADQQAHQADLQVQLAALTSDAISTEAQYAAGVAAAAAAAAAAREASGGAGPAGQVMSSGWARPSAGHITSGYGMRLDPVYKRYQLHSGTDLGASCNSPIYAAHSGTVVYAGPYGGYGNFVKIMDNDGSNLGTGYGHIVNGGILVHVGQVVTAGQNIAKVGRTGAATGCHLHFEVYKNGTTEDPVPFMRSQGVELAN